MNDNVPDETTVTEAPEAPKPPPEIRVEISEENYETAVIADSGGCLMVDAIEKQHPQFSNVKVDVATVRVTDKKRGYRYYYLTPQPVAEMLFAFDQGWREENLPKQLRIRTLLKVLPITRSASDIKKKNERRKARLEKLETKAQSGELTSDEKRALSRLRNPKPSPKRPAAYGAVSKDEPVVGDELVVVGGKPPPSTKSNPNMLAGRDRHFAAKRSKGSVIFEQAVKNSVEEARQEIYQKHQKQVDRLKAKLRKNNPK
jgi:hypothetical protein